jgi:hypothetical protein
MPASPPKPDKAAGRSLGPLKPAPTDQAIISDASSFAQFFIREIVARVNRTYPGAVGFVDESMRAKSVLDRQGLNFDLRRPPERRGQVARPDAPF